MKLRELGLRPVDLAARVYFTHRASSTEGHGFADLRSWDDRRRAWRALLGGDPTELRRAASGTDDPVKLPRPPRTVGDRISELTKWVCCWPEPGYGFVVGLTYRQEGIYHAATSGSWEYPTDPDPAYLSEFDRHPLYVVRQNLRGRGILVPPWAIYPLADGYADYDVDPPTAAALAAYDGDPDPPLRHSGDAFADYVDSLAGLLDADGRMIAVGAQAERTRVRPQSFSRPPARPQRAEVGKRSKEAPA